MQYILNIIMLNGTAMSSNILTLKIYNKGNIKTGSMKKNERKKKILISVNKIKLSKINRFFLKYNI